MFIDTHTHLYLDKFNEDIDLVINRAKEQKVTKFYLPNIDRSTTDSMLALASKYPDSCIPMMGLHPCSVGIDYEEQLGHTRKWLDKRKFVAIGEIGIDLYWDKSFKEQQINAFKIQIEWAREFGIPFVIHSRDSLDLTISIVEEMQDGDLSGIFHCFNGTPEQRDRIKEIGFYVGLGGIITFKNSNLVQMIETTPIDMIVLETDSPYLAPTPYRGKRNESSYIPIIAERLAEIKSIELDQIAKITTKNAESIFKHHAPKEKLRESIK